MAYSAIAASSSATASNRRRFLQCGAALAALLTGLAATAVVRADDLKQSGTVRIEQVQIAFIGSGNLGGGTLKFGSKSYDFTIGGLGVGGFGVSKITATGTVYNLDELAHFPGAYVQGRYGMAIGDVSTGKLWLKNNHGVVLALEADRKGLALSLGGDAIYINLD
ncbi:MAG TPA: hypothetical protein VLV76_17050 [Candidatus Acidoferrum sp.]|nr:hypothetical protein [Candidatus Acidoferrum sp.]